MIHYPARQGRLSNPVTEMILMNISDIYKSISDEIIARLQARNRIILGFSSVSVALIGAASAEKGYAFVAVGIGFYSLVLSLLNRHHELFMARLIVIKQKMSREFYVKSEGCEHFQKELQSIEEYTPKAYASRDLVQLLVHGFLCVFSLVVSGWKEFYAQNFNVADQGVDLCKQVINTNMHDLKIVIWSFSCAAFLASMVVILNTTHERKAIFH